jgi:hypothetical protein
MTTYKVEAKAEPSPRIRPQCAGGGESTSRQLKDKHIPTFKQSRQEGAQFIMSFRGDPDHEGLENDGDLSIQVYRYSDWTGVHEDADDRFVVISEYYVEEHMMHCADLATLKKAIKRIEISPNPSRRFFELTCRSEYAA